MSPQNAARPVMLMTGSSGLIGSMLVQEFGRDFTVVGMDTKPPEGEHLPDDFVKCDLTSDEDVGRAFADVRRKHGTVVASMIHLAAYYDFAGKPSELYRTLTVEGTQRVLRELKKFAQVEQFVFSSSLLVMEPAEDEDERITETSPLEDEPWDYPRSKIEAEAVIKREHDEIPAVILRIAGVYDEEGHSIPITQHIARIYEKQLESYFFPGNPEHGTPYIHLADLVTCVRRVVDRRAELGSYSVFLIAEPDVMSYDDLQDTIGDLIHGKEWPTIQIPKAPAKAAAWVKEKVAGEEETFIKPWMVDLADAHYPVAIRRAREQLGWEPRFRLRTTLPEMIRRLERDPRAWYEKNGLPLPDGLREAKAAGRRG